MRRGGRHGPKKFHGRGWAGEKKVVTNVVNTPGESQSQNTWGGVPQFLKKSEKKIGHSDLNILWKIKTLGEE